MDEIAQLGDGNFYYVEDLTKLDEFFVDALAALLSIIAQDCTVSIKFAE
jgi:hypothetical protein